MRRAAPLKIGRTPYICIFYYCVRKLRKYDRPQRPFRSCGVTRFGAAQSFSSPCHALRLLWTAPAMRSRATAPKSRPRPTWRATALAIAMVQRAWQLLQTARTRRVRIGLPRATAQTRSTRRTWPAAVHLRVAFGMMMMASVGTRRWRQRMKRTRARTTTTRWRMTTQAMRRVRRVLPQPRAGVCQRQHQPMRSQRTAGHGRARDYARARMRST